MRPQTLSSRLFVSRFPSLLLVMALGMTACSHGNNTQQPANQPTAQSGQGNTAASAADTSAPPTNANNAATVSQPTGSGTGPQSATVTPASPGSPSNAASLASRPNASATQGTTPTTAVLPAGTTLNVRLDSPVSTKSAQPGQEFNATLSRAITRNGQVVVPSGTPVSGRIVQAAQAGRFKGGASLSLRLSSMTVRGTPYRIATSSIEQSAKGRGKRTAIMSGGGAALGGIVGGLAGGGKGAAIGLITGGGAGAAGSALTGNRDIELPAETPLAFRLTQAITIR